MTRSAITSASFVLALCVPVWALAQDTTTPPATSPATPTDTAAPPAALPGDQAAPVETDAVTQPQPQPQPPPQPQPTPTTTGTSENESGQGLQSDMDAATADQQAETTPLGGATTPDAAQEEEKLPFRGSIFFWDHSYNMYGLALPYSNPTYAWWFSFRPRWYFGEDWYAAARFDLYYELTDSDSTTTNRELTLGDIVLSFARPKIAEVEHFRFGATASLTLPASIASRANGLIVGTGIAGRVTREFEDVLEGLTFDGSLSYTHNWSGRNVSYREEPYPCAVADPNVPGHVCEQGAGTSTVAHSIVATLTGSLSPVDKLSFDLSYSWWWRRARDLADATVDVGGTPVMIEDGSLTHWRNLQVFSVSVGYDIVPWLNASLSWGTLTTQLNPSGSFRNPFANPDSTLSLTATVALDELYKVFRPTPQTVERNQTATASTRPARARQ